MASNPTAEPYRNHPDETGCGPVPVCVVALPGCNRRSCQRRPASGQKGPRFGNRGRTTRQGRQHRHSKRFNWDAATDAHDFYTIINPRRVKLHLVCCGGVDNFFAIVYLRGVQNGAWSPCVTQAPLVSSEIRATGPVPGRAFFRFVTDERPSCVLSPDRVSTDSRTAEAPTERGAWRRRFDSPMG